MAQPLASSKGAVGLSRRTAIVCALLLLVAATLTILKLREKSTATTKYVLDDQRLMAILQPKPELMVSEYDQATLRKGAMLMNPELAQNSPNERTPYNSSFKNPCWTDELGVMQCLPHLILLGGFHSGSGSLSHAMSQHPNIVTTSSSANQFWAEDGKKMSEYLSGWRQGIPKLLQAPAENIMMDHSQSTFAFYWSAGVKSHIKYIESFRVCYENCTKGGVADSTRDECMEDLCMPQSHEADQTVSNLAGLDYMTDQHTPFLMRSAYGAHNPRLLAVIRDPVERLHSSFWGYPQYKGRYGASPEGFLAFVRDQLQAFEGCSKQHGALQCALLFETLGLTEERVFYHCDQLLRGLYSLYIEVWMRFFPQESMLLIKSEDLFKDMNGTIIRVAEHAGVSSVTPEQAYAWAKSYKIPRHVKGRAMLPEARALLHAFYVPYNRRLAHLTKNNAFLHWNMFQESKLMANE